MPKPKQTNPLAEQVYSKVKQAIFDFELLPGDRFTENELAEQHGVSRTPVRDALYRLQREGYLEVGFRSGWSVSPFDFPRFDELYDLRIMIEIASVERLCQMDPPPDLDVLKRQWLVAKDQRVTEARLIAALDEAFHSTLVRAAGNREIARVHEDLTEKIRIIRRLDFLKSNRIEATYDEHAKILRLILKRQSTEATILLRSHVTQSKNEVRKITLHMLHQAREAIAGAGVG
ncbi:GntR family transcriptional regulator [Algiphilus sp. W345]|uniref:GntR family transcriptional regulator n=1 Tax=Banduia mediterranea TaxID=3075609 RepID=A0ABU2WHG3_9GAMM|nr:GntR family transcriptional regulator [Algiphilus sp. W345]MDT0497302.1 GntR family transcriptional regulator [Algiphilus sp. W345]